MGMTTRSIAVLALGISINTLSNFSRLDASLSVLHHPMDASVPIGCTQFMQARQAHQAMDAWLDASVGLDK